MELSSKKVENALIVGMKGRLDALTSPNFEDAICKFIREGEIRIVFDLGDLDYISSAGLRAILSTAKRLKAEDGAIAFANITGMISEVFEISGFGSMFNIYGSALLAAKELS
ncbi:STAS domain-containing protein [Maridesulfovibrio ferrireducens]|uniref:Anti-sigma factor antagonist n=1 Tax=Maridesulfovibrio ferrireducens TaxID=246191 RepID=A0A1G9D549_9BACT|nr:STAS domain-containing protein [Maridesulfovibrio ferrireducens]SDK58805.1 STAS domain-containing protein [Maridesulfovibrio ferrireducens]